MGKGCQSRPAICNKVFQTTGQLPTFLNPFSFHVARGWVGLKLNKKPTFQWIIETLLFAALHHRLVILPDSLWANGLGFRSTGNDSLFQIILRFHDAIGPEWFAQKDLRQFTVKKKKKKSFKITNNESQTCVTKSQLGGKLCIRNRSQLGGSHAWSALVT